MLQGRVRILSSILILELELVELGMREWWDDLH